jgi:hypothetical protein
MQLKLNKLFFSSSNLNCASVHTAMLDHTSFQKSSIHCCFLTISQVLRSLLLNYLTSAKVAVIISQVPRSVLINYLMSAKISVV